MTKDVINLGSVAAEKQALKLCRDLQAACTGKNVDVVACALIGLVLTLPDEAAASVCAAVARSIQGRSIHEAGNKQNIPRAVEAAVDSRRDHPR